MALFILASQAQAQRNATGEPAVTAADSADLTMVGPNEDSLLTATRGTIADPDGISNFDPSWVWRQSDTADGDFTGIVDAARTPTFTPLQAQVGKFLQTCAVFFDDTSNDEVSCWTSAAAVANVNDAPTATSNTVTVKTNRTSSNPHTFSASDFPFADEEDGDMLASVIIKTLPTNGTLSVDGTELTSSTVPKTVHLADIGTIGYWPAASQSDTTGYATFTFNVIDDGSDGTGNKTSTNDATMTIDIARPTAATGEPAVAYASNSITVPTEDSAITASQGTITDPDNTPTNSLGAIAWQWSAANTNGGSYTDISTATAAAFTPGDDEVGKFLQVCASFTDSGGGMEQRCHQIAAAVANINDPASGLAIFTRILGASDRLSGAPQEDATYSPSTIATIVDPDGLRNLSDTLQVQWSQDDGGNGVFTAIAGATTGAFTPTQVHVGNALRVCASFTDDRGGMENLCLTTMPVANVNDKPMATANSILVPAATDADDPYEFSAGDFTFTDDEDGDSLVSVTIVTLPATGTLSLDGTALSAVPESPITAAQLDAGALTYYPEIADDAFTFRVTDDGHQPDATTDTTSDNAATMTMRLASAEQVAATGAPTVTAASGTAHNEDVELTASTSGITDPNGINASTLQWQWHQAPAPATGTPADGAYTAIAGANTITFTPEQAHVGIYIRVCASFMDMHATPASEGPLCSNGTIITNVNDAPVAESISYQAARDGDSNTVAIPVSAFTAAYMDADPDDSLASVTITTLPDPADGTLHLSNGAVQPGAVITITDGEFENGPLTFTIAESAGNLQETELTFTLSDGTASSDAATLTITFGKDIAEQEVVQASAILAAAAITNATSAIGGAISSVPTALSIGGTSLKSLAQTLHQSKAPTNPHHAWYHSTTANWEYTAAYNASDNSRASLLNRLQSMANGDIAINYSLTDMSTMRFWARYQSLDISGNEGETLEYDGSGTGFYIGADNQITDTMRIGLAIGTDSADITLDLDEDGTDDEATRSATSFYPYLHIDLGNNNNARVIAGFGSGTLDIKSTANSNSTASADLSWNMLAASISHHRPMKGALSARFDGSLQLGNTSTDETTFTNGSTLMAGKSSASELTINAELRYQKNNITPFASLATRKLGGDLSQSVALDMAFGADLQTNPANLRIAITRQINDTTHQRHSISLDASTNPNPSGITASLGSNYDTITGKPQWRTTIGWQRHRFQTSLQASPGDYRLRARLRW